MHRNQPLVARLLDLVRELVRAARAGGAQGGGFRAHALLLLHAERLDLDPERFFEIASASSGQCWSLTSYCPWPGPVATAPSNRAYEGGFAVSMMLKDLKLAQGAAATVGVATPLGAQAEALYALFDRLGYGEKDFSGLLQFLRGRLDQLA